MSIPKFWIRNGWTVWHLVGAIAMTIAGIFVTWEAWVDIYNIASGDDQEAQYVFLVPFIAVWLVWVRRGRFRNCMPRGQMIGVVFILLGWLISIFGYYKGHQALWHAGAVMLVCGCTLSVVGRDMFWKFLPIFVLFIFLIPVPGRIRAMIAQPLQTALAYLTQQLYFVFSVDLGREGNSLTYNGHPITIAEACNGMRLVFSLVMVSYAFAFATPLRGYVRLIILIASPLTALLVNIVRMIPTVWLYGNQHETIMGFEGLVVAEAFHDWAPWPLMFVAFFALMGIIRVLEWALIPVMRYTLAND